MKFLIDNALSPRSPLSTEEMTKGLGAERIRELARGGAEAVLKSFGVEIIAIERTFPELALPKKRRAAREAFDTAGKRGRTMSAAARKDVSERMKKYCTKPLRGSYPTHQALIAA